MGSTLTGSSTLTLSNASLSVGESCSFDVTVLIPTNAASGTYTNNTSIVNLDLGGATTQPAASSQLVINRAPVLEMEFIDDPVSAGDDVTLRYTVTNSDDVNLVSDLTFDHRLTEVLPGLSDKVVPLANSCGTGSTFTIFLDNDVTVFRFMTGELAASASCSFDLELTLATDSKPGEYVFASGNITGTVASESLTGSIATATLSVGAAPSLTLAIVEDVAKAGDSVNLDLTLSYNSNAVADVTDVAFTVGLEGVLSGLVSTSNTINDECGIGSSLSGTSTLTLSGATLSAGEECEFSITLQIPSDAAAGEYTVSSSTVSGVSSALTVNSAAVSDTLLVSGLTFSKQFIDNPVFAGDTISLEYTIANAASALTATDLSFSDRLSETLSSLSAVSLPSIPCGVGSAITGTTSLNFSGGMLAPGESCSFSVDILIPVGADAGTYNSVSRELTATVNGVNTSNSTATDTFTIEELTVVISTGASNPTSDSPIPINIDFSRAVDGFELADITVTGGSASNFAGSGASYTADITPDSSGVVSIDIIAEVANDSVVNAVLSAAALQLSLTYEAPTVVLPTPSLVISEPSVNATSEGPVVYTVTYSDAEEINLTTTAITLDDGATGTSATVVVTDGDTATATVSLTGISGNGTLGFSIDANTARNGLNLAPAAGPSTTFNVDTTQPTVTITDVVADPINAAFTSTFTFSEGVSGFTIADITPGNASLSAFSGNDGDSQYTVLVTPTNQGTVTLDVAENVASDSVSNFNTAATQHSVEFDSILPTVVITGSTSVNAPFTATITFSESVNGFAVGNITPSNASLSSFSGSDGDSEYTVLVTPTADGTVTLDVAANVATDAAVNSNTAATQFSASYDNTPPTVTITDTVADPFNAAFTATITFSENVTGFTIADITPGNANLSAFSGNDGDSQYTVLVTPTNQGTVTLDVASNVATDSVNNANTAAAQHSLEFDSVVPGVVITGLDNVNAAFTATITFSESVNGFVVGDITPSNASLSSFSGSDGDSEYTVLVTPTADGAVTLDIAANVASDAAANNNTAATQFSASYDNTPPTVTITDAVADPFNAAFTATITFSENVTGFTVTDITPGNASLSAFSGNDGDSQYTVLVTPTNQGTVTLDVASNVATDSVSNANTAAAQHSLEFDSVAPSVAITGSASVNAAFTATISFSEGVNGFVVGDIVPSNASLSSLSGSDGDSEYTVLVTPTADGIVTLDVAANVATDAAVNSNTAATQFSASYDNTPPTVTITDAVADPFNAAFTATITFSENVTGFTVTDITPGNASLSAFSGNDGDSQYTVLVTPTNQGTVTLDVAENVASDSVSNFNTAATQHSVEFDSILPTVVITGSTSVNAPFTATITFSESVNGFAVGNITPSNASLSSFSGSDGDSEYTVLVTPTADGAVTLDVAANVASDGASNNSTAATQFSASYDNTPPTVTITDTVADPFNAAFTATITFSENVTGFTVADITPGNASLSAFSGTDGDSQYTVLVTPTNQGTVTLDVAENVATDSVSNANTAAAQHSLEFDSVAPSVAITGSANVNAAFTATITFSENVSGFIVGDISVVNANLTDFSGSDGDNEYTVLVTPIADGAVTLDVAANVASDGASNNSTAATQFSASYDNTPPTVTITDTVADPFNAAFTATITFSENVTGFTVADITPGNASLSAFSGNDGDSQYTVLVTPTSQGTVTLDVASNVATDSVSNANTAAAQHSLEFDSVAPSVAITGSANVNAAFTATITFSESVNGFVVGDITPSNASLSSFSGSDGDNEYTVLVTPTADGAVTLDVAANVASDGASNNSTAATQFSASYDNTRPTVTISDAVANPYNAAFTATITFSEDVTGFAANEIIAGNATLSAFTANSSSVYTVLVTPTNQGSVTLDIAADVATDSVSNGNTVAAQHTVEFDNIAPSAVITGSANVNAVFTATITFSENVTGFVVGDVSVNNGSLSAFTASSGSIYTVLVTPTTDGPVTLDLAADVAADAALNNNVAAMQFGASYDNTAPTVSITDAVADPFNAAFTATITFSEDVTGFTANEVIAGNATLSAFAASSSSVYTVLVTPTNQGSVTLDVAADVAIDSVNNGNLVAPQFSLSFDSVSPALEITSPNEAVNGEFVATFTFSEAITEFSLSDIASTNATFSNFIAVSTSVYTATVTPTSIGDVVIDVSEDSAQDIAGNGTLADSLSLIYDPDSPNVEMQGPAGPVSGSIVLDIVFNEEVSGFVISDITSTNATLSEFVVGSASTYSVTVTPVADGTVTVDIASSVATDSANNSNTAAAQYSVEYDSSSPEVLITGPEEASINVEFTATFTFNSNVIGFTESDIVVTNASLSNFLAESAAVYSVVVTPSADGEVTLNIPQGVATDSALNANNMAEQFNIVFDTTGPILNIDGPTEMVNDAFTVSFVFNESVSGFEESDVTLVNAMISDFTSVDESNYSALITPIDTGIVTINVAADVAVDEVENGNSVATEFQINAELGALTVILSGPEVSNSAFTATAVFNRNVSDFTESDFSVVNADLSDFTAISSASYSVLVTPVDNGDVSIFVDSNTVVDAFNTGNEESNLLELNFDSETPLLESNLPEDDANIGLIDFDVSLTFSEPVIAVEGSDKKLELFEVDTETALQSFVISGDKVEIIEDTVSLKTPLNLSPGSYFIQISAGALVDAADNPFEGIEDATTLNFEVADQVPIANDDEATVSEDGNVVVELLDNDSDVEDKLVVSSVVIATEPLNGQALIDDVTGNVTYTPNANFSGEDTFTYSIQDESGQTSEFATVTITVTEVNDGPMAADDIALTLEDVSLIVDVLANDLDIEGGLDSSTLEIVSPPSNGMVTIVNGQLSYVPTENYSGSDTLTYRVQDTSAIFSNVAMLTINITSVVDLPLALNDTSVTDEDTLVVIELLNNDSGVDSSLDSTSVVVTTQPANGTVTVNMLGDASYQPDDNFFGEDSFSYSVADVNGTRSATAISEITVESVNDVPQFTSVAPTTSNPLSIFSYQLLADDADGDALTFNVIELPTWLVFDGVDLLSGTPDISDVDQSFSVVMSVTDDNILQPVEQSFELLVTAPELSDLLLSQEASENPVLVGNTLELDYVVLNQGPNIALLDTLTIELSGTSGITTLPDNCVVEVIDINDIVSCDLKSELAVDQSTTVTLSLPVTLLGNGEIQSKMSLTQQVSDLVLENLMLVVVADEIVDEEGDLLTPSNSADSAFGDLNNDGLADLVIVNSGNQANQILFNSGSGVFVPAQTFGDGSNSRAVALIDLDNDNALDIVVANTGMSASGYYINQGDGSYGDIVELGEMRSTGVSIADFNGDGLVDIVFANGGAVGSRVFLQPFDLDITDGGLSLQNMSVSSAEIKLKSVIAEQDRSTPIELALAKDATAVGTGDYNGDGFTDIVMGYGSSSLELFLNDGNGNFTSLLSLGISDVGVITTADINNDGVDDIFISYPSGNGVIFGAFNTTSESLSNVQIISQIPANDIGVADINQNGSVEVILVNNPGGITTYTLEANSEFERSSLVIATSNSDGLALADIDGDGDIDIVITSEDDSVADEILFNQGNGRLGAQTVDLAVSLSAPNKITKEVYYTTDIVISNIGVGAATNLVVNFEVVNGLIEFLNDGVIDCQLASMTQARCTIEQLAAGEQLPLAMTIKGTPDTTVMHSVSISNDRLDDNASNNQASAETIIKLKSKGGGSMTFLGLLLLTLLAFYRNQKIVRYRR